VNALLRSEWLKVFSTRMWIGMLVGALAFTAINVVALVFASGQQGAPALTDPATVRSVYASAGSASVLVLVLGILGMTTEFRHMTVTSTFLATPRRGRVMSAKMAVHAVVGAAFGLVCAVFATGLAALLLQLKDHAAVEVSTVVAIGGGTVLCFAIYAVVGVALGALIRNQIAAILFALVWVLLVEALVVAFLPAVGKWLPGGAASGVLQSVSFTGTTYLPVWAASLLLLGYGVAFGVLAAATTLRRDIT
jgi:ABC-2 type transport system permease protein